MSLLDTDSWQEIYATLRKNRLRTFLTACGVFWGIFMLLIMLGFGNGLETGVSQNMRGFATNAIYVWGRETRTPYKGMQPGRHIRFENADIAALSRIEGIEHLAPRNRLGGWRSGNNVTYGTETGNFTVMGDYPTVRHIQPVVFERGRFLNEIDIDQRRKVAVIGASVYKELFPPGIDPIGEHIHINGVYFQVVGTFRSKARGDEGDRQASTIFLPFTTFQQAFNRDDRVGYFAMTARPGISAQQVEDQVRAVLTARHDIHPDDELALGSFNAGEEFGKVRTLFLGIRYLIWFVGVMTLLAGVIGVSNIMLIVVKERTKEIGVRKALGATPASIVGLILQEAVVLTALAGYTGVIAGVGFLELLGRLFSGSDTFAPPQVDLQATLIAAVVLVVAGAVAGVIPARMAARVNPVEALRAE